MSQDSFAQSCDRLSQIVDAGLYERLRWERNEGPKLAKLVALTQSALQGRGEFELVEEGATRDVKRFVLKVHGNRAMAIALSLSGNNAVVSGETIDRAKIRLAAAEPVTADFAEVDEAWMAGALERIFARAQPLQQAAEAGFKAPD